MAQAHDRLRPEWVKLWVALPQRFQPWPSPMPPYFGSDDPTQFQEIFPGTPLDRITAVRDALMILPRVERMPVNQLWLDPVLDAGPPGDSGTKKKNGDMK
jgi:hypothetical protein